MLLGVDSRLRKLSDSVSAWCMHAQIQATQPCEGPVCASSPPSELSHLWPRAMPKAYTSAWPFIASHGSRVRESRRDTYAYTCKNYIAAKSQSRSHVAARCNSYPHDANMRGASAAGSKRGTSANEASTNKTAVGGFNGVAHEICMHTRIRCMMGPD